MLSASSALGKAHPKKKHVNLGIAQKGRGGGRNACPNCLWQFFSEYKPLLSHLIFINFTNIYHDFHQNTIPDSCLTTVAVKIFIPKVEIAVFRIFLFSAKNICHKVPECILNTSIDFHKSHQKHVHRN